MSDITIQHFKPIDGEALAIWNEAWASFVSRGITDNSTVPYPTYHHEAWCARVNGVLVGIQAVIAPPGQPRVSHAISWVKPENRGQGVWTSICNVMDADLKARGGHEYYISFVIADEPEMLQAVLNRGGVIQQYRTKRPIL